MLATTPATAKTTQAPVKPWTMSPAAIIHAAAGRARRAPNRRMIRPPNNAPTP